MGQSKGNEIYSLRARYSDTGSRARFEIEFLNIGFVKQVPVSNELDVIIQQHYMHLLHYRPLQIVKRWFSVITLSQNMADSCGCLVITMNYVTLQVLYTHIIQCSSIV